MAVSPLGLGCCHQMNWSRLLLAHELSVAPELGTSTSAASVPLGGPVS
jgi:hypothetical protein